ncbi:MAG: hypothetical protein E6Q76_14310 [Rhizobium sp.]|nr:MAG: hypothetical protein E6Q76_14310 [Rhizobium sp.]
MENTNTPARTQSFKEAFGRMQSIVQRVRSMDAQDLDEITPLMKEFRESHAVVMDRLKAIESDPLLAGLAPPSA